MEPGIQNSEKEHHGLFLEFVLRFQNNRLAVSGFIMVVIFLLVSVAFWFLGKAEVHFPHDPNRTAVSEKLLPPSVQHPFGTDELGRDVLSRMLHGAHISLMVGFVAVGISLIIGVIIGALSGFFGGVVDRILMRVVDIVLCFPSFFLILTVVALLKPSFWNVMIVIGLTSWPGVSRLVRAEFLSLKERDYVMSVRALGAGTNRIIFLHILPNAMTPVLVVATLGVAGAILTESGLSFLGFGVQPPQPTWGNILTAGRMYIFDAWWLTVFPGLAILFTVLSFHLFGEGLRDALDPKLKV